MSARIKVLSKEKCTNGLAEYFSQADCHIHSFSHCVFSKRGDEEKKTEEECLKYARKSMIDIYAEAKKKNLKVAVITEHPQFNRYGVDFEKYLKVFNDVSSKVIDDFAALPLGFELDIRRNEKTIEIDLDIKSGTKTNIEMFGGVDVLVFSMHAKHYVKSNEIKNSSDFLDILICGINRIGEFNEMLLGDQLGEKICILGHPWDAAFETNIRAWERDPDLKKAHSDFSEYESSKDVQIKFFTAPQLSKLSETLVNNKVYPELNIASLFEKYLRKGSNISKQGIIPAYIDYCLENKTAPIISVGSDSHLIEKVGELKLDTLLSSIKNIDKAVIWCENYKYHK